LDRNIRKIAVILCTISIIVREQDAAAPSFRMTDHSKDRRGHCESYSFVHNYRRENMQNWEKIAWELHLDGFRASEIAARVDRCERNIQKALKAKRVKWMLLVALSNVRLVLKFPRRAIRNPQRNRREKRNRRNHAHASVLTRN
jgi:hypothetical protein